MTVVLLKAATVAILLAHLASSVLSTANGDAVETTGAVDSGSAAFR